jgi:hypothetical protein
MMFYTFKVSAWIWLKFPKKKNTRNICGQRHFIESISKRGGKRDVKQSKFPAPKNRQIFFHTIFDIIIFFA